MTFSGDAMEFIAAPVEEATRRKVAGLLGLGVRGRLVVVGAERVKIEAQKGAVQLAIIAPDASRHTLDKVVPILRARHVQVLEWPSAAELGEAVGRETTAAVGILDQALARGIRGAVAGSPPASDASRATR